MIEMSVELSEEGKVQTNRLKLEKVRDCWSVKSQASEGVHVLSSTQQRNGKRIPRKSHDLYLYQAG